jgi:hypothetical protein
MDIQALTENLIAIDEDVLASVSTFIMEHNPGWLPEYQELLDKVSSEFIPFIDANPAAHKTEFFFQDMERNVEGESMNGYVYIALLNLDGHSDDNVVKAYELFFPVDEQGNPQDAIQLMPHTQIRH